MTDNVWGILPEKWKLGKIGSLYELRNQKVSDRDYQPLSVTKEGVMPQLDTAAKTNAHDDRKLVRKGDFAINSRSDRRGSCGVSSFDGSVSLINTVLKPRDNMNPGYYNWLFHTTRFADEFYKWGHGIVDDLWTTGWPEMKKINIPVPPIDMQIIIADFLDSKCSEIDSLTKDIKHQIEVLEEYKKSVITEAVTNGLDPDVPMKDSGVEWIGEIPEKWDVLRLKHSATLKGRIGWQGLRSDEYKDEGPYLITGTDFDDGIINWATCQHISIERYKMDSNIQIKEDDLLVTKDGTIGKVAIAENCPEEVSLNSGVFIVRNNKSYKYDSKYFYYIMLSNEFSLWYDLNQQGGSTIKHLTQDRYYNFSFSFPQIDEQKQIAEFLDKRCSEIDFIIADKKKQLDILAEYKKSLIYEYVTGKKEVSID